MIDGAGTNHFVTLMIFMNHSCILKIGMSHTKVHISPRGGGEEGTAICAILVRASVKVYMVFKQFTLG